MSERTKIQWCDSTASPWTGCQKRGPSCDNCYAEAWAARHGWVPKGEWGKTYHRFKGFERTVRALNRRPWVCAECGGVVRQDSMNEVWCLDCGEYVACHRRRVFPSLCDWLDTGVPMMWMREFLETVQCCNQVEWLLLTKNPNGFKRIWNHPLLGAWMYPQDHVAMGLSAGTQQELDSRIEPFLRIPAKRRFLSVEPLLERMNLGLDGIIPKDVSPQYQPLSQLIHAVIVGGESDTPLKKARVCKLDDIRDVIRQCKLAGVRCWVKQVGANVWADPQKDSAKFAWDPHSRTEYDTRRVLLADPKGADPAEWPEDLRVREDVWG